MNEKNNQFINLRDKVPESLFKFEGKPGRMNCKGSHDGVVMVLGGGGVRRFFLACEDIWEKVRPFIPTCAFFLKWGLARTHLFHSFSSGSVHSDSANRDDCVLVSPDELRVSSFPDRFPHYAWTAAQPAQSDIRWVKGVCVFRCNLPPALSAE